MGEREAALSDDTALPDQRAATAAGDDLIRVLPLPVQREQVGNIQNGIIMPLLADGGAVHAENTNIAVPHLIVVDEDDGAVREVGSHGVTLKADSKGGTLGIIWF